MLSSFLSSSTGDTLHLGRISTAELGALATGFSPVVDDTGRDLACTFIVIRLTAFSFSFLIIIGNRLHTFHVSSLSFAAVHPRRLGTIAFTDQATLLAVGAWQALPTTYGISGLAGPAYRTHLGLKGCGDRRN